MCSRFGCPCLARAGSPCALLKRKHLDAPATVEQFQCSSPTPLDPAMATSLTRRELYDLVWSKPISKLVEHFGVSGVAIAKACSRAHVPVPPRGWWARRAAGQSSIVQVRPGPRPPGLDDTVTVGGGAHAHYYQGYASDQEILDSPIPPEPSFDKDIGAVRERVMAMVGKFSVSVDTVLQVRNSTTKPWHEMPLDRPSRRSAALCSFLKPPHCNNAHSTSIAPAPIT